nr:hypothetical protein CFP56_44273 [Quercus suber]
MSMEKREGRCVGSNTRNALVVIVIIASAPGRRKAALLIVVLVVAGTVIVCLSIARVFCVVPSIVFCAQSLSSPSSSLRYHACSAMSLRRRLSSCRLPWKVSFLCH